MKLKLTILQYIMREINKAINVSLVNTRIPQHLEPQLSNMDCEYR